MVSTPTCNGSEVCAAHVVVRQVLYQRLLVHLHALQRLVLRMQALKLCFFLVDHGLQFQLEHTNEIDGACGSSDGAAEQHGKQEAV